MDLDDIMSARKNKDPPHGPHRDSDPMETKNDQSKRVYVSNLPWSCSWQDLKDFFRQAGNVVYANVMMEDDKRSKGCGIVEFETVEEALKAIETLHDAELDGRRLTVREDREDKKPVTNKRKQKETHDGGRRVFVSNLSWTTSWQDLKDYFRQAGNVVYANIMMEDNRSKGCGIVEFETSDEAGKAIDLLHDTDLDGRPITVREDREDRDVKQKGKKHEEVVRVGRRVYVGNLAWSTSWQDLKDFFRQAGDVVYANIMTDDETGRSKGCGIVEFASSDNAVCAIETLHDAELDGRRLTVREDREDKDLKGGGGRNDRVAKRSRSKGVHP